MPRSKHPFSGATERRPVLVVGAGIAGLTAAWYLGRAGVPVRVIERSGHHGGRMQTGTTASGARFETGQQFYYGAYRETRRLLAELGLLHQLRPAPVRGLMTWRGRVATFDKRRPWLSLLSARENLGLLWALARKGPRLLSTDVFSHRENDRLDTIGVDTHFGPRLSEAAFELAIRPMVTSYSFAEPEGHSLAMLLKIARLGATSGTAALIAGNDALPRAMARGLEVLEGEVRHIRCDPAQGLSSGPVVGVELVSGARDEVQFIPASAVICAAPPPQAAPLMIGLPAVGAALAAIPYTATLMVNFHLASPIAGRDWVYILSRRDGHRAAFAIDCARRCPEAFPDGSSVLQVSFVNPTASALMDTPDAELARIARDDMAIYLPDLESRTQAVSVVRRPLAVPAYQTGSFAKIAELRAAVRSVPNLFLVGDYLRSPLVESAVRSALDVVATS